jgi:hypothetical protein
MTPMATAQFGRFSGRMPDLPLVRGAALAALAVEPIVGTLAALVFLACGLFPMALRPTMAGRDLLDVPLAPGASGGLHGQRPVVRGARRLAAGGGPAVPDLRHRHPRRAPSAAGAVSVGG